MTALPDSLRVLASLRKRDENGFARLLNARRVNARGIEDLLDLAEWLLVPSHVSEALDRLDWPTMRGLRLHELAALERAMELGLAVEEEGAVELLPEVARQLEARLPEVPNFNESLGPVDEVPESAGTVAAHVLVQLANDALWLIVSEPRLVRETRDGVRLSGIDIRKMATDLETESVVMAALGQWLFTSGLVAPIGDAWHLTRSGHGFPQRPVADRWRVLAQAWLSELTLDNLRTLKSDNADEDVVAIAVALGVIDRGRLTQLGAALLDSEIDRAVSILEAHLPAPVTQVYVQPDQSILAPGPLTGELDRKLRRFATLVNRALASEYRLTPASLTSALNSGMRESEIREFLGSVSLTGIPQPVDYLISNTAEQHGRVRVRATDRGAVVTADSSQLIDALAVDSALGSLDLVRRGDELLSRVGPQVVLASLLDARYPAVIEDIDGDLASSSSPVAEAHVPAASATAAKAAAELAEQAANRDHGDDRSIWVQRRLELARRNKSEVRVKIDVPGKEPVVLSLVPVSVGAQRLRARDLDADVERTLPLRSIIAVEEG